jgi:FtsH-binding integral membrane protein
MKLILINLILMLNVAGLTLFAAVSIYRGEHLAASGALFLAGLVVLLMALIQVLARKESSHAHRNRQPESGSQAS